MRPEENPPHFQVIQRCYLRKIFDQNVLWMKGLKFFLNS